MRKCTRHIKSGNQIRGIMDNTLVTTYDHDRRYISKLYGRCMKYRSTYANTWEVSALGRDWGPDTTGHFHMHFFVRFIVFSCVFPNWLYVLWAFYVLALHDMAVCFSSTMTWFHKIAIRWQFWKAVNNGRACAWQQLGELLMSCPTVRSRCLDTRRRWSRINNNICRNINIRRRKQPGHKRNTDTSINKKKEPNKMHHTNINNTQLNTNTTNQWKIQYNTQSQTY